MVHGSPRPGSNSDVFHVLEAMRARGVFDIVHAGYMECNEPDIPEAVRICVKAGAGRVIAVPYFLHPGTHVADDLPRILNDARAEHPGVDFLMGTYIGRSPRITGLLARRARECGG